MKKKNKQKKDNSDRWLLTYSDLITLLMALFVLMYAMSNVDQSKYEEMAQAFNKTMGSGSDIFSGSDSVLPKGGSDALIDSGASGSQSSGSKVTPVPTQAPKMLTSKEDMNNLEKGINKVLNNMKMSNAANTSVADRGLTITLANDAFFESGKADITGNMKKGLGEIANLLAKVKNPILIEGHTDNVPISSDNKYTTNWQLSSVRAANVADYLNKVEHISGSRLMAVGYGEYQPVATNTTDEGRKKNRRVEITILYNDDTGMIFDSQR